MDSMKITYTGILHYVNNFPQGNCSEYLRSNIYRANNNWRFFEIKNALVVCLELTPEGVDACSPVHKFQ